MNPARFGCHKFRRLSNEKHDRELSQAEKNFLDRHRSACAPCRSAETDGALALNMLRQFALEADEPCTLQFEERVIRRWRVQHVREGVGYWSPALMGAIVAGVAVLAALQLVTRSSELPRVTLPGTAEALRELPKSNLPDLLIENEPITTKGPRNGS